MKSFSLSLFFAAWAFAIASGSPLLRRAPDDTANGMLDVLNGDVECAPVAVIFARGTFDSGNIGVWVGPAFANALSSNIESVAFQGVDPAAYKANLSGYLTEGGSNDGAASLASTVKSYAASCPDSAIVISGWSQGALVAHKGLNQLDDNTLSKIAGVVTCGDPWHLFSSEAVPGGLTARFASYCITGTIFDPLCADLPADFKVPTSLSDIVGPFKSLPNFAQGVEEVEAAASLVLHFPKQLAASFSSFVADLTPNQFVRLLLTPQHFLYGNNGMTTQAAQFIAGLPSVQAAIQKAR